LLADLPAEIRQKVKSYRRWQDAHGALFGKLLLQKALIDSGYSGDLANLWYTEFRRPYLPEGPDFNIYHSGCRVVCALSLDGRIGIDLEEVRDLGIDDFRGQFTPHEWQSISSSAVPLFDFYTYWTAKESVLKADGRGLTVPLSSLVVMGSTVTVEGFTWKLKRIEEFGHYICHVAYDGLDDTVEIKEFLPDDI
jgi:4'-phosphopantetheinyl transferase